MAAHVAMPSNAMQPAQSSITDIMQLIRKASNGQHLESVVPELCQRLLKECIYRFSVEQCLEECEAVLNITRTASAEIALPLKEEVISLRTRAHSQDLRISALVAERDELRASLDTANATQDAAQRTITRLRAEYEKARVVVRSIRDKRDAAVAECKRLGGEMDRMKGPPHSRGAAARGCNSGGAGDVSSETNPSMASLDLSAALSNRSAAAADSRKGLNATQGGTGGQPLSRRPSTASSDAPEPETVIFLDKSVGAKSAPTTPTGTAVATTAPTVAVQPYSVESDVPESLRSAAPSARTPISPSGVAPTKGPVDGCVQGGAKRSASPACGKTSGTVSAVPPRVAARAVSGDAGVGGRGGANGRAVGGGESSARSTARSVSASKSRNGVSVGGTGGRTASPPPSAYPPSTHSSAPPSERTPATSTTTPPQRAAARSPTAGTPPGGCTRQVRAVSPTAAIGAVGLAARGAGDALGARPFGSPNPLAIRRGRSDGGATPSSAQRRRRSPVGVQPGSPWAGAAAAVGGGAAQPHRWGVSSAAAAALAAGGGAYISNNLPGAPSGGGVAQKDGNSGAVARVGAGAKLRSHSHEGRGAPTRAAVGGGVNSPPPPGGQLFLPRHPMPTRARASTPTGMSAGGPRGPFGPPDVVTAGGGNGLRAGEESVVAVFEGSVGGLNRLPFDMGGDKDDKKAPTGVPKGTSWGAAPFGSGAVENGGGAGGLMGALARARACTPPRTGPRSRPTTPTSSPGGRLPFPPPSEASRMAPNVARNPFGTDSARCAAQGGGSRPISPVRANPTLAPTGTSGGVAARGVSPPSHDARPTAPLPVQLKGGPFAGAAQHVASPVPSRVLKEHNRGV